MSDCSQAADNPRLVQALEEYLVPDEDSAGRREQLLSKYADIAEELTACLDAVQVIHELSPHLIDSTLPGSEERFPKFDDYRVLREIGRGGMGVVYEAEQLSLSRRVALKVLPLVARLDQRRLARFKNEAQAAALLQHPHIVAIYSVGCSEGVHFFAMQYVDGVSLAELIAALRDKETCAPSRSESASSLVSEFSLLAGEQPAEYFNEIAALGVAAARGLDHAHESGVVHRDVKPSNLLLDRDKHLWIADFGLAQTGVEQNLTLTDDKVGTLPYMSPEQISGPRSSVDHRTDVYSLGVTLYELLTLSRAFDAESAEQLRKQIEQTDPPPPRRCNELVPEDLNTIVLKAMSKDPQDRYDSAGELADDLVRFRANQPILARRPTIFHRWQKRAQRHRAAVATTLAAAILMLLVMAAVSTYSALRINRIAEQAQQAQNAAERSLSSFQMTRGVQLINEGRYQESLAWLVEPLKREGLTPQEKSRHRVRLQSVMNRCPRAVQVWLFGLRADSNAGGPSVDCAAVNSDGSAIGTGHADGLARIWDVATGKLLAEFDHRASVKHIAFSPVDHRIASAAADGTVNIWHAQTGEPLAPSIVHSASVSHVEFSPNGRRLATMTDERVARVWNALDGTPVSRPIVHLGYTASAFGASTNRTSFSPDGSRVVTSYMGNSVRVWNAATGAPASPYLLHDEHVVDAQFSLNGDQLLVITNDRAVHVWEIDSGRRLQRHDASVRGDVTSATSRISPDRSHFVTTNLDGSADVVEVDADVSLARITGRNAFLWDVAFGSDGSQLVSVHYDGHVALWDLASGLSSLRTWQQNYPICWGGCTIDGRALVATASDDGATLWQISDDNAMHDEFRRDFRTDAITAGSLSRDGKVLALTGSGGLISVWNASTGQRLNSWFYEHNVRCAALDVHGQLLFTAATKPDRMTALTVWSVPEGTRLRESKIPTVVNALSFAPESQEVCLAVSDYSSGFARWKFDEERFPQPLAHANIGRCAAYRQDGKLFATGGKDQTVRIWDAQTLEPALPPLSHRDSVEGAAFSPDGELLATCTEGGLVHVWEVATGLALTPPLDLGGDVRRVWFDAHGRQLYSADLMGRVRRWNLSTDQWPGRALIDAARVISGRKFTPSGELAAIESNQLRRDLAILVSQAPRQIKSSEDDVAVWHELLADECMSDQQWDAAAWHHERLIRRDPENRYAYRMHAKALEQSRRWKSAAKHYQRAIELGADQPDVVAARRRCRLLANCETIIRPTSTWRWMHPIDGADPADDDPRFHQTFAHRDFDDGHWHADRDSVGSQGGFGYGNRVGVEIGAPDVGHRKTAYFRHKFETEIEFTDLILALRRDDGVIVYLDGVEAARDNIDQRAIASHDLLAKSSAGGTEGELIFLPLPGSLAAGKHVLAISVHNRSIWSSDLQIGEISLFGVPIEN